MADKIKLSNLNCKIKPTERSRGRMKITLKFSKDEAESLKAWTETILPEGMSENDLYRQAFFIGIETMNNNIAEMARKSLDDPETAAKLKEQGIDVDQLKRNYDMPQSSSPVTQPKTN